MNFKLIRESISVTRIEESKSQSAGVSLKSSKAVVCLFFLSSFKFFFLSSFIYQNMHLACTGEKNAFMCATSILKMSGRTHHMDNRFPQVKRHAWIVLFVVNSSEAWNHSVRSMQMLPFQLRPKYVLRYLSLPSAPSNVFFPQNMILPTTNKAVDFLLHLWASDYCWSEANSDLNVHMFSTKTWMECGRISRQTVPLSVTEKFSPSLLLQDFKRLIISLCWADHRWGVQTP